MLVLVESRKKPAASTTTPVTRQNPRFFAESFKSVMIQVRVMIATITVVMITGEPESVEKVCRIVAGGVDLCCPFFQSENAAERNPYNGPFCIIFFIIIG